MMMSESRQFQQYWFFTFCNLFVIQEPYPLSVVLKVRRFWNWQYYIVGTWEWRIRNSSLVWLNCLNDSLSKTVGHLEIFAKKKQYCNRNIFVTWNEIEIFWNLGEKVIEIFLYFLYMGGDDANVLWQTGKIFRNMSGLMTNWYLLMRHHNTNQECDNLIRMVPVRSAVEEKKSSKER